MNRILTATLLIAALAVSACTNPDRFGADGMNNGAANGAGLNGGIIPGSANDPASTAYFQQAVGDRVLFLVDQSNLTPEGQATLDGQAAWLNTNTDYQAVIEGHADEQGTREYNIALGERRAQSVETYLLNAGVSSSQVTVVSYGEEKPAVMGSTEYAFAQNRRGVVVYR